jgi:hypothetical protein
MANNPFGFRTGSPSPSSQAFGFQPTPSETFTVTWKFTCLHTFTQEKQDFRSPFESLRFTTKIFTQKCPECAEADEDKYKEEREAIRAKEEALRQKEEEKRRKAAKAFEHQTQALEVYKAQAITIQKHIDSAGDNAELRGDLNKMLDNCKFLWANKVKKAMTEAKEPAPTETLGKVLLKDKLEKVRLLSLRAKTLRDQERAKQGLQLPNSEKMSKMEKQVKEWTTVVQTMKEALDTYESMVSKHLDEVEEKSAKAWDHALWLIKEE